MNKTYWKILPRHMRDWRKGSETSILNYKKKYPEWTFEKVDLVTTPSGIQYIYVEVKE